MLLLLLGLASGALSTVAGMGGGMLLVLTLSLLHAPLVAIAVSAPALLLSNLHRSWLYRRSFDRRVAGAFVLGAVPGALAGSFATVALPEGALPFVLLGVALFAVARGLGWVGWDPGPRSLTPAGAAVGGLAAVSGAGLVGPVLFAVGLRGDVFIATASASAVALHFARAVGYGVGGLFDTATWSTAALLALGLVGGNLAGRHLRKRLGDEGTARVGYVAMAALVLLAVAGLA